MSIPIPSMGIDILNIIMIQPFKNKAIIRLKKAKGQIDGIIKMIEDDKYCIDVLTQVLALQGSVKAVGPLILDSHLNTCAEAHLSSKDLDKKQKFIAELVRVCELSNR